MACSDAVKEAVATASRPTRCRHRVARRGDDFQNRRGFPAGATIEIGPIRPDRLPKVRFFARGGPTGPGDGAVTDSRRGDAIRSVYSTATLVLRSVGSGRAATGSGDGTTINNFVWIFVWCLRLTPKYTTKSVTTGGDGGSRSSAQDCASTRITTLKSLLFNNPLFARLC
jgi:hypothetical protein